MTFWTILLNSRYSVWLIDKHNWKQKFMIKNDCFFLITTISLMKSLQNSFFKNNMERVVGRISARHLTAKFWTKLGMWSFRHCMHYSIWISFFLDVGWLLVNQEKVFWKDCIYFTRKYPLRGYVPSSSRAAKEDNVEERENSEVKQFFGWAELCSVMLHYGWSDRRESWNSILDRTRRNCYQTFDCTD